MIKSFTIPFCRTYCGSMFTNDPYYDTHFIEHTKTWIEDLLADYRIGGCVTVSEVCNRFFYSVTPESLIAGWIPDDEVKIDYKYGTYNFGNGKENVYWVTFTCREDVRDRLTLIKVWKGDKNDRI